MSLIHPEVLDKKRQDIFSKIKIFKDNGYLAGGTALSLQIKHRYSFDFDIFLGRKIKRADYLLLKQYFGVRKIILDAPDQLTVISEKNIKITLLFYPYRNLFPFLKTKSLPLLSLKDIAADKVFTIGRRGAWRDYFDLFFLLQGGYVSLLEIIKLAKRKFKKEFNEKLFLEQLVYFRDLGEFKIALIGGQYTEDKVKKYLIKEVKTMKIVD